ncbi:G-protein coupled receptor 157-like [Lingula anatina]|uniref:G-protein coupled receptor 157-like n=1 Tax=Lingula anatina TaxID=7574 RepID=A0A1S3ITX6_LINAN|nr:G-protein coupled receptor 157-like [Lingula anatina]|eukprot:XP_013401652.1 G-protein coupled receptor 157-like [Lingula anatina]
MVIWTYLVLEDVRTTSRKLLMFASVADIVTAACFLMGSLWYILKRQFGSDTIHTDGGDEQANSSDITCVLIGAISSYSQSVSFWWNMATALYLYLEIVQGKRIEAWKWLGITHVICWGVPAIPTITAACYHVFGFNDVLMPACSISRASICWLKGGLGFREYIAWTILTLKGTEILTYFQILVLYLMIAWHVSRTSTNLIRNYQFNREDEKMLFDQTISVVLRANRKLIAVPLLLIGVRIWGTLRMIVMVAWMPSCTTPYPATEWIKVVFMLMEGAGNSAQGLANGVIFCAISNRVRSRIFHDVLKK